MSIVPFEAFAEVNWTDYSSVAIHFEVSKQAQGQPKILRVRFSGDYASGSAGSNAATYMDSMYRAAFEIVRPDAVVLDFSALRYDWGDNLGKVFNLPDGWSHSPRLVAAVVGEDSSSAIRSLLIEDLLVPDVELDWIFSDLSSAVRYVREAARALTASRQAKVSAQMKQEEFEFWNDLGSSIGPESCRIAGCGRLRIKQSVHCRPHHFELIRRYPSPFSESE